MTTTSHISILLVLSASMLITSNAAAQKNAADLIQNHSVSTDSMKGFQKVSLRSRFSLRSDSGSRFSLRSDSGSRFSLRRDSLVHATKLSRFTDSLKILTWGDSMRMKVNSHFAKLKGLGRAPDSLEKVMFSTNRYKRKTDSLLKITDPSSKLFQSLKSRQDSLKKLKMPGSKYVRKVEKAAQKQQKMLAEVNAKQKDLEQKVTGRYTKWESSLRSKLKLDSFGIKGTGNLPGMKQLNAPNATGKLPDVKTPGLNQNIPGMPKMPALNTGDFSSPGLSKELSGIGGNLSIPSASQLGQWDKKIPGLNNNPLKDLNQKINGAGAMLKDPSKSAENALSQVGDVQTLKKEIASAEKLKSSNEALQMANKMKDADAMKAEAQKQAVNHFAGKEDVLKKSMDEMAKYKKKYHSLNSLAEAKKMKWWQPVNGLKGKPFRERIHPGVNLGYNTRADTLNLDFFPNVSYQLSGRVDFGFGGLYRLHINTKSVSFDQASPVWGLTGFTTFKLFKSTLFRLETDAVNSPVPKGSNDIAQQRSWRWQLIMGVQNNFKISSSVTGNMQMLYNFDKSLKDGFPERLMLRVGVAFNFKRRLSQ